MPLEKRADEASQEICEALDLTLTDEQKAKLTTIVDRALADAIKISGQRSSDVATACCGPERDLAHKISDQIKREQDVLFAKLSGYPGNR